MDSERLMPLPRIAAHLHQCLSRDGSHAYYTPALERVAVQLAEVARCSKRLRICRGRSWSAAGAHERGKLTQRVNELEAAIRDLKHDLSTPARRTPSLRELMDDLREIDDEFGDVRFERNDKYLAVTTEPIVLQDIALGRFELRLYASSLANGDPSSALHAISLEPHPCASDDAVTHPHVSGERICLGDATAAFQSAISSGRLADALQIARVVLNNYNPGSPYCSLDSWYGKSCHDCGRITDSDDGYWCEHCENGYCDDCFSACVSCGDSSCRDCLSVCALCDENVCSGCMVYCTQCDRSACMSCLDDGLCPACVDANDNEENEDDEAYENQVESQRTAAPESALTTV